MGAFIRTPSESEGLLSPVCFVCPRWLNLTRRAWPQTATQTEAEMENGVRSNQHGCHDYVQFTPTCNQATDSAATKPMWQWQVDWMRKAGQEARKGGWRGLCGRVQPISVGPVTLTRPDTLYTDQLLHTDLQALVPILFCPCRETQWINIITYRDKNGSGNHFHLFLLKKILYLSQGWKEHRVYRSQRQNTLIHLYFVLMLAVTEPSHVKTCLGSKKMMSI